MESVLDSIDNIDLSKKEDVLKLQMKIEVAHTILDFRIRQKFQKRGLVEKYDEVVKGFQPLDVDDLTPENGVIVHNE